MAQSFLGSPDWCGISCSFGILSKVNSILIRRFDHFDGADIIVVTSKSQGRRVSRRGGLGTQRTQCE